MPQWHFFHLSPGSKVRNPIQGEFFSDEAIGRPGQALVREAIQNSLDARIKGSSDPVKMRIYVSEEKEALVSSKLRVWLKGLWPHLQAKESGIRKPPNESDKCRFVVIEDAGTTGLEADEKEWKPDPRRKNGFFAFLRAEGLSFKTTGDSRGKWGVGKTVFPRTSLINSFFALTVRASDPRRALLLGNTVLRVRELGGEQFTPDGWFGDLDETLVLPLDQGDIIRDFQETFRLTRKRDTGLSVVIPFADPLITAEEIVVDVAKEYFWPILTHQLEVTVEGPSLPSGRQVLDNETLPDIAMSNPFLSDEVAHSIALAQWALALDDSARVRIQQADPQAPPSWSESSISEEELIGLRERFSDGERLAVRIQVDVKENGYPTVDRSHFDVVLQRDLQDRGSVPQYIRNGITIPDIRTRRLKGHRIHALILIDHPPLSQLLGDAETPAHTQWHKDTANFRDRYRFGAEIINYVTDAPRALCELLTALLDTRDRWTLAEYFPAPFDDLTGPRVPDHKGKVQPGNDPAPKGGTEAKETPCEISMVSGGFRLSPGSASFVNQTIRVAAAYDRIQGNPLRRYRVEDFAFESMVIEAEPANSVKLLSRSQNVLTFRVLSIPYSLVFLGFDAARDVIVKVEESTGD